MRRIWLQPANVKSEINFRHSPQVIFSVVVCHLPVSALIFRRVHRKRSTKFPFSRNVASHLCRLVAHPCNRTTTVANYLD